jgi:anti-sigma factor RsiW
MTSRWDGVDFGDLTCQEFVELVTGYLDDTMDRPTRARFEQHLSTCPGCADYVDQIRTTRQVLGRVDLETISDAARGQLLTAFRTWRSGRVSGDGRSPA